MWGRWWCLRRPSPSPNLRLRLSKCAGVGAREGADARPPGLPATFPWTPAAGALRMLGGFLGHPAAVRQNLAKRAEFYAQEAAAMEDLRHPQALQLLGRYCVFPGLQWYLRQHAAAETTEAQHTQRQAYQRWVGVLVGRPAGVELPGETWRQVHIVTRAGGVGAADTTGLAALAHVSGWAATAGLSAGWRPRWPGR